MMLAPVLASELPLIGRLAGGEVVRNLGPVKAHAAEHGELVGNDRTKGQKLVEKADADRAMRALDGARRTDPAKPE